MKKYHYIIIGGGMTGAAAVMGIRQEDREGRIAMFTKENFRPYNRPPLSKGLWTGKDIKEIMRPLEKFDVDLFLETHVTKILPTENAILTENDEKFTYEKLLLANGGEPITLPDTPKGVIYFRTLDDFQRLSERMNKGERFCVIGGGFIGSEIAAALNKKDKNVTMIFPEVGISGYLFPDNHSLFLNEYYREKGINIFSGHLVEAINKKGETFLVDIKNLETESISTHEFDGVIVGIGIQPNIQIAQEAGINTDDGILVNRQLQTNIENIFAAGDVAQFYSPHLDKKVRVEHEDNANNMGLLAGKNMTGSMETYDHLPFFYSDLFDLGYEAVGEINKEFNIVTDWIEEHKKGTIFYLQDEKIRGLVFWNLWGQVDKGRKIISEGKTYTPDELVSMFT